jgi:hypothetical protein
VYGHVLVEDYVHRGVEKLRNWNPVLIKIVFLISIPCSELFHADPRKGVYKQIEVRFVLCALSPTSNVWILDPLHYHHHYSEEWRGIHGLPQMIMCEQLCSSCWVFRIVNRQSRRAWKFLADDRFIHSVSRIAYTLVPSD